MRLGVHIAVSCALTASCALVVTLDDLGGNTPDASEDTALDSALVGKMDEVAIYAKALTTAQMTAHFHAAGH